MNETFKRTLKSVAVSGEELTHLYAFIIIMYLVGENLNVYVRYSMLVFCIFAVLNTRLKHITEFRND